MSQSNIKLPLVVVDNVKSKINSLLPHVAQDLSQQLSVKVPNYWFSYKYQAGLWDGTQKFFDRRGNTFPTGLLSQVVDILVEAYGEFPVIVDNRMNKDKYILQEVPDDYRVSDHKDSRDYQIETMNSVIRNKILGISFMRGVINIATNGGKTNVAMGLIKELYPQLVANKAVFCFVTHSKEIAHQAKASMEKDLEIPVGFIGDGKWEVETVTIVIITTLYRRKGKPEFKELCSKIAGFIADECHHSQATSWYDTLNLMENAVIRLGLTGTVDKSNPVNEMRLYSCTGGIISRITNEYLIEQGFSARPVCIWFKIDNLDLDDEAYQDAYSMGVVDNPKRLDVIRAICKKETDASNTVLILVEHIEHGEIIKEGLKKLNKEVFFINGQLTSDIRQQLLDGLKNGSIDVLIATSILDEGVDVSNINAVIYARGMKSSRKLLQGIGRGLRKKEDGSKLRFYDFIDDTNVVLLKHSMERYKTLKSEKFISKKLTVDEYLKTSWKKLEEE